MAADKSFSDIDLAEFQTPNRRASGLIKGAEAFHRISDEPEPEDAFMPALGLSPIKEYVEGKSGMQLSNFLRLSRVRRPQVDE